MTQFRKEEAMMYPVSWEWLDGQFPLQAMTVTVWDNTTVSGTRDYKVMADHVLDAENIFSQQHPDLVGKICAVYPFWVEENR